MAACIRELTPPDENLHRDEIWHLVCGRPDANFARIMCSRDEGIVAPGHVESREPTCPACLALVGDTDGSVSS